MMATKKGCPPAQEYQADTTKNQNYYNSSAGKSQGELPTGTGPPTDEEWGLGDMAFRAKHLDPKKWDGAANLYQYKININHPELAPIYKRFCFLVTGRRQYPISDTQRFEFERMVLSVLTLYDKTKEEKIRMLEWEVESIPKSPYWVSVIPGGRHLEHERFAERFQR